MSILWGPDKDLDYWTALQRDLVPIPERRAVALLASLADEQRFSFYCYSGMFPALGNVTKRTYFVRRFTTVLELQDGRPVASWCILAQDRNFSPETDHVVALKNILEGSELGFRETGNPFHFGFDPFRGSVDIQTDFPNPYYAQIGPSPSEARPASTPPELPDDPVLDMKELAAWKRAAALKAQVWPEALASEARKWVEVPPKPKRRIPITPYEEQIGRVGQAMINIGGIFGLQTNGATSGTGTLSTNNITFQSVTQPIPCTA